MGEVLFWCAVVIARALSLPSPSSWKLVILAFVAPGGCAAALYLVARWARRSPLLYQAAKFSLVGFLNTAVDFGVLDLLLLMTGHVRGSGFAIVKTVSFLVAVVNSYLWNKFWTFKADHRSAGSSEFVRFLGVSAAATLLNVATAALLVQLGTPPPEVSPLRWANLGALLGTVVAAVCNFLGYKYFVFRQPALRRETSGEAGRDL